MMPKEKVQSMKKKKQTQKRITSFPCIFPKDEGLEHMSQSEEMK